MQLTPLKDTKQTRIVKKSVPTESFFNFFSPPKAPADEGEDDEEDDAASDIEERLELDYQLGEDIKEKLIPRAVDWFTGEALAYEELDEDDLDGEDFDDDDDEDDDDLSEDHDDDEETDDEVRTIPNRASRTRY
jgi:nucleosome assembly protein 1-like 1